MQEIDMQDPGVRRKIFWLLQRVTCYSLWHKKRDAFRTFSAAYETAVKTWSPKDPELVSADHLATIYEILSLYDRGLDELAHGRRFVWRKGEALDRVVMQTGYLSDYFYTNPNYWVRGGQFLPYPPKVGALARLLRASMYQAESALLEVAGTTLQLARLRYPQTLLDKRKYHYTFYELEFPQFPNVLPEMPQPRALMIRSGERVPCDGIWDAYERSGHAQRGLFQLPCRTNAGAQSIGSRRGRRQLEPRSGADTLASALGRHPLQGRRRTG
jgi:hypothetical protein